MSRVPIHDHSNIHQGGKIRNTSVSGVDLSGASGPPGGGSLSLPIAATDVAVADAGTFFTATNAEDVLQELAAKDIGYTAHGNTGSTETFDALTAWHSATLNANCTFTFTGATSGLVASMVLELTNDTGSRTVTWPGSVVWASGSAPTLGSGGAASVDVILVMSRDGGTTWYGFPTAGSSSSVVNLDDLGDVTITSPATADRLRYDGSEWVNSALVWTPLTVFDGTTWLPLVDGSGNAVMAEA